MNKWLRANKISLNTNKTEIIIFHAKNERLTKHLNFPVSAQKVEPSTKVKYLGRSWNLTFQYLSLLFSLMIIHLQESPEPKTTNQKHKCASLCNIVKEQITKTWFINETLG